MKLKYGYDKDIIDVVQSTMKVVANSIRSQTQWLWDIQVAKKDKLKDPKKFWTYTWDKDNEKKEPQTKEQMVGMMKLIGGIKPKKKK